MLRARTNLAPHSSASASASASAHAVPHAAPASSARRQPPRRVTTILASVLASASLGFAANACGGAVASDVLGPATNDDDSTSTPTETSPSSPRKPTSPTRDASVPDSSNPPDAGCTPYLLEKDAPGKCADVWYSPCGIPAKVDPSDGLTAEECELVCGDGKEGERYWGCSESLASSPNKVLFDCYTCVAGRRPEDYASAGHVATIAEWLGNAADLERVSVDAFQILQRELVHYGAPSGLVRAAARAEADEVRHAATMRAIALEDGARLSDAPVAHGPVRSRLAIALENAVEGCVRETYGAIVAAWQAKNAARLDIRRAMAPIAREEAAHADLAWRVHAWLMDSLSASERAEVEAAMADAVNDVVRGASAPVPADFVRDLGLPAPGVAEHLASGLVDALWANAA